ncbi:hypothetical protein RCL1_000048 [Eukaryota sp. TZLM3-RCL]
MRLAVSGCVHGCLNRLYDRCLQQKVDVLLCTGDFQGMRDVSDLASMAVTSHDKLKLGDFYSYFIGEKTAHVLTLVVGGNHENSTFFCQMKDGGWLAPNIFFIGFSGIYKLGDLTIAGLSGIHKSYDYNKGYHERFPLNESDKRSIYHIREFECSKISSYNGKIDILLTHDWPLDITFHGDASQLFRIKPQIREDAVNHRLGSPGISNIIQGKKPTFCFASHHHIKWGCTVRHADGSSSEFLALNHFERFPDKSFHVFDVDSSDSTLCYDPQWLAILKKSESMFPNFKNTSFSDQQFVVSKDEVDSIEKLFPQFEIPFNWEALLSVEPNPQTVELRSRLQLPGNPWESHYWTCETLKSDLVKFSPL